MMNSKLILLLSVLAFISVAIDEFKNPRQMMACIQTCTNPISTCLKEHESACAKAYVACHASSNFLTCIESANSLMMQDIAKCMRKDCKSMEPTATARVHNEEDSLTQLRAFTTVKPSQAYLAEENSDDVQAADSPSAPTAPTDSSKTGNRR